MFISCMYICIIYDHNLSLTAGSSARTSSVSILALKVQTSGLVSLSNVSNLNFADVAISTMVATQASRHWLLESMVFFILTMSPTRRPRWGCFHFCCSLRLSKYVLCQRVQNYFARLSSVQVSRLEISCWRKQNF